MASITEPLKSTSSILPENPSRAEEFACLPEAEQIAVLEAMTDREAYALEHDWSFWARPEQIPPDTDWRVLFWLAGRGAGKALSLETPIPTTEGWSTMGDLEVGDLIFDEQGKPTKVRFVTPVMHNHPCYEVRFSDGSTIVADADHLWMTHDKAYRKSLGRRICDAKRTRHWVLPKTFPRILTTEDMSQTLTIAREDGRRELNHAIPLTQPLDLPEISLTIDPYVLGAWLGDGDSRGAEFTTEDPEILREIEMAGYAITHLTSTTNRYHIGPKNNSINDGRTLDLFGAKYLRPMLAFEDLLNNKHIPATYKRASTNQRIALLQGLMDTDGHIDKKGTCEYTTISQQLASDVHELCISLGIKTAIKRSDAKLNGRWISYRYRLVFTPFFPVFRLSRKRQRHQFEKTQQSRKHYRFIESVVPTESVPVRCIQVDSPSHLFLAGSAMIPTHNTRPASETVNQWAENANWHIAIVGETAAEIRDVMVEGESGIIATSKPWNPANYEPSKRRIVWPESGTWATLYSGDSPDQLRGPNSHKAWVDELAKFRYPQETWDNLRKVLRAGDKPQCLISSTPRPIPLIKKIIEEAGDPRFKTMVRRWSTYRNFANLAPDFIDDMKLRYEGTRLGRQELHAEILLDTPGALWTQALIDQGRVARAPSLRRIVVGVDPPGGTRTECGIIVGGLGEDGHGYILDDMTLAGSPETWSMQAVTAYTKHTADRLCVESNFGGDMVISTVQASAAHAGVTVATKKLHASRGKYVRAEPVAALYEQGRVHHVGNFGLCEDELTTWAPNEGMPSPNRLDALVWVITELMLSGQAPPILGAVDSSQSSRWRV